MTKNILILCTGNSARSILAESLINELGEGRYRGFSAGSKPTGTPNPFAIKLLQSKGVDTGFARSKTWDEFGAADAPQMDFIITVCDNAAGETCPFWPGRPTSAHWGIPDPAAATGSDDEILAAFELAYQRLSARITAFMELPDDMSDTDRKAAMAKIGQMEGATGGIR